MNIEMGEHIFTVDFGKLKSLANKIKVDLYRDEIVERINKYSNDKNELKLATIIDFTNEIVSIRETLFSDEDDDVSGENLNHIVEYLENFVNHEVFKVSYEDMDKKPDLEPVKEEKIVVVAPSQTLPQSEIDELDSIEQKSDLNLDSHVVESKSRSSSLSQQYLSDNKDNFINPSEKVGMSLSKSELSDLLKDEFSLLVEMQKESMQDEVVKKFMLAFDEIKTNYKSTNQNAISKSESDKKVIIDSIDNMHTSLTSKFLDTGVALQSQIKLQMESLESHKKFFTDVIEGSINNIIGNAITENKIKAELDKEHVKSLKGVKVSVILVVVCLIFQSFLLLAAAKWHSNSLKYENIQKVRMELPPYEQDLFQQIITTGRANTRENPRQN